MPRSTKAPALGTAPTAEPMSLGRRFARWARALTLASAGLLVAGGYVHFCLYRHGYRFIPKIGPAFVLQFTSSVAVSAALVFGSGWVSAGRWRFPLAQMARLAGVALAVGTLGALAIAHTPGGLFGFREIGLRPAPQTVITVAVEWEAAMLLGVAMVCSHIAARLSGSDRDTHPRRTHLPHAA